MNITLSTCGEILDTFGSRLRTQRLAQDLPQRELAQMAGVSLGALRKLEVDGYSSLETLVKVVQALGLVEEMADLFSLQRNSIAQMEKVDATRGRQRASRRQSS